MKKTLYHKTSKGEIQEWTIHTEGSAIITTYGLRGGKMQTATKRATGKNIGRANETTPEEQAILQTESMANKKRDKGYFDTIDEALNHVHILPMLAHDWFKHERKYNPTDKFFVQPKLDGVRCLAQWDGSSVKLISRGNKTYDVPNVQNDLAFMFSELDIPEGVIFDGELYRHGMEFADISGACKKLQDSTDRIQFHIYDILDMSRKDMKFSDRYAEYIKYSQQISSEYIRFVITYENTPKEFDMIHDDLVEQGFEGLIIRHPDLPYKLGKRSQHLLKYKKFEDAEFKIVDVISGEGKFENKAIFVCSLDDGSGLTFNVVAKGTDQERESYLTNRNKYIGEMMTVKFFGRSEDNIPRFPVGKGVRMRKDMS